LAPHLKKAFERLNGGPAATALPFGAVILKPQSRGGRHGIAWRDHPLDTGKTGQDLLVNKGITARLPYVTVGKPAYYRALRQFPPKYALPCGPGRHGAITLIGPGVSRFLVTDEKGRIMFTPQVFKNIRYRADPNRQEEAEFLQILTQIREAFLHEIILPPRGIGLLPQLGFDNVERQDTPLLRGKMQCGVVVNTQITFEPANDNG
jgi:hypothetical protein